MELQLSPPGSIHQEIFAERSKRLADEVVSMKIEDLTISLPSRLGEHNLDDYDTLYERWQEEGGKLELN